MTTVTSQEQKQEQEKKVQEEHDNTERKISMMCHTLKSFNSRLNLIQDSSTRNIVLLNMLMFAMDFSKAGLESMLVKTNYSDETKALIRECADIVTERTNDLTNHVISPQYSTSHPFGANYATHLQEKYGKETKEIKKSE